MPAFDPEDLLHFVELDEFIDDWKSLGLNDEADLFALQVAIMADPRGAPVIEGTGGVRKFRFAVKRSKKGKSGGVRVCYAYLEEHFMILLCAAYDHREKENPSVADKRGIKQYLGQINNWLSTNNVK